MKMIPNITYQESTSIVKNIETYFGIVFYFILIIGGTLGNILGLIVIRSARTMHTTKGVFTGLMVADTIALWINPVRYWIRYVSASDIRTISNVWCKVHTFGSYTSRDCATWVLVLMTFERFVLTFSPNRCHEIWKPRHKILTSVIVLVLLILKNSPVLFKLRLILSENGRLLCDTGDTQFRIAFFYLDITVYSLVPSVILLICNAGLLRLLHKARDHRQGHTASIECSVSPVAEQARRQTNMDRSVHQANRLLIPVSIFHLLTSMPLCVFSIVEASFNLKQRSTGDVIYSLGAFFSMLTGCNNGVNCIIYFLSSLLFRILLRRYFRSFFMSNSRHHKPSGGGIPRRQINSKENCIPLRIKF